MERLKILITWILLLLPIVIVFKNFYELTNPLVWGDAPYFYPENLNQLFNLPFAWEIINSNFGSSQLLTLWLFLPTYLMGLLYKLLNLNNELLIRIVFYIPFLAASLGGIFLLLSKFKFSKLAVIFGTLFFVLNTYSLMLIDGGQIGVLLSYGLFPLSFYTHINYLEKNLPKYFLLTLTCHFLIFNTDLRIALVLILFELIWWMAVIKEKSPKHIWKTLSLYGIVIALSGFWFIPLIFGIQNNAPGASISQGQNFINLSHSFYLFQPHFPDNDFGNLNPTPIYFIFLPIIFFLGLLSKNRQITAPSVLLLIFIFLAKGANPPAGEIYNFLINHLPLGSAFRDSSKFYIPAILIGSILIANTTDFIKDKFNILKYFWLTLIYIFLLITIYPAFSGGLTGALGNLPDINEYQNIYQLIKNNGDFRSLWFNEKPSMGFADWDHPPVSANSLFKERPFASIILGDYDLFYFLHNRNISNWFELLGIKYVFYPPNQREKSLTPKEKIERTIFEDFISRVSGLTKVNLPVSFPVYQTQEPQSKIFAHPKALFVIGGDEIYQKLFKLKNFELEKAPLIFLESCKFDVSSILTFKPDTFALVYENQTNLYLSFFCNNFNSPVNSGIQQWSVNTPDKYLNWKAQLKERGIENYDYDFNKGLAYSSQRNEILTFEMEIPESQNYYLPIRYLTSSESNGLQVNYAETEIILKSKNPNKLEWELIGPISLNKSQTRVTFTNLGGLSAVNTVGLISQQVFDRKKAEIDEKLNTLTILDPNNPAPLEELFEGKLIPVNYLRINPSEYQVNIPKDANWLTFSERFDPNWHLESYSFSKEPLPAYSMLNGYYIGDIPYGKTNKIYYQPQKYVNWGIILSLITFFLICFSLILHIIMKGTLYDIFKNYNRHSKN